MRKITLTKDEANILYTSINQGNPQQGLTLKEIRDAIPLLDKMECNGKEINGPAGKMWVCEKDFDLELKESEYILAKSKIDASGSWISVSAGRVVVALADKLAELPTIPEPTDDNEKKEE